MYSSKKVAVGRTFPWQSSKEALRRNTDASVELWFGWRRSKQLELWKLRRQGLALILGVSREAKSNWKHEQCAGTGAFHAGEAGMKQSQAIRGHAQ